jgi:hypothetical protein
MKKLLNLFRKNKVKANDSKEAKIIYDEYFIHIMKDGRPFGYYAVNYKQQKVLTVVVVNDLGIHHSIKGGCMAHLEGCTEITKEQFLEQYDFAIEHLKNVARP